MIVVGVIKIIKVVDIDRKFNIGSQYELSKKEGCTSFFPFWGVGARAGLQGLAGLGAT